MIKSRQIRAHFASQGYTLPTKGANLNHHVFKFADEVKENIRSRLEKCKENGTKFNITLDEWSSKQKKRYVNVNAHFIDNENSRQYINLGMIFVEKPRCTAEYLHELVVSRLQMYGLSENDIFTSQSDGASVMLKFGRLASFESITCYSHALHLAVSDILYDKMLYVDPGDKAASDEINDDEKEEDENDDEYSGSEDDENDLENHKLKSMYADTVKYIRGLCKYFNKSIPRNAILQKHIKAKFNHEIALKTDMRIRWDSIFSMLDTSLRVKDCIQNALTDIGSEDKYEESFIKKAEEIHGALAPLYEVNRKLGKRDTDLLMADILFETLFKRLEQLSNESFFAKNLLEDLKVRVNTRRSEIIVSCLKYLHNPIGYSVKSKYFDYSPKKDVKKFLIETFNRLNNKEAASVSSSSSSESVQSYDNDFQKTMNIALETLEKSVLKTKPGTVSQQLTNAEKTGVLTDELKGLHRTIKSVPVTSIEAERNFSLSGYVVAKHRTRLSTEMIDATMIIKSYFIELYKAK